MHFNIQSYRFPLTAPLHNHAQRRLRFALTRTMNRITGVVVRLGDTNVPQRGADKFCRIQVYQEHTPPVFNEEAGPNLYVVIDRAAARAGRTVAK